jgi:hypothetical protein
VYSCWSIILRWAYCWRTACVAAAKEYENTAIPAVAFPDASKPLMHCPLLHSRMEKPGTEYGSQTLKLVHTLKMVPEMIQMRVITVRFLQHIICFFYKHGTKCCCLKHKIPHLRCFKNENIEFAQYHIVHIIAFCCISGKCRQWINLDNQLCEYFSFSCSEMLYPSVAVGNFEGFCEFIFSKCRLPVFSDGPNPRSLTESLIPTSHVSA